LKCRRLAGFQVSTEAKVARTRRIQGQYLGALRRLRPADRARVKKVAAVEGVPAAVQFAAKLHR
jgi:hypothetical protein